MTWIPADGRLTDSPLWAAKRAVLRRTASLRIEAGDGSGPGDCS